MQNWKYNPIFREKAFWILLGAAFFVSVYIATAAPPRHFPENTIISVHEGTNLLELSEQLAKEKVIRSPFWFRVGAIILGGERGMQAGEYYLPQPENNFRIVWRIVHGSYNLETVKLTIPEGFTVEKISKLFDERFPYFDHRVFEVEAPQGYLFPDTYFVTVSATASSTIKLLRSNFTRKIFDLTPEIEKSGRTLEQIVTMASLIEAEARTQEDRLMVSDVLWKRLKLGMPLQVDSEMGTYEYNGLPDEPINNPGLQSISAAIHPTTTPYLYFLSEKDGTMHYSKTFDEHAAKVQKYLR